jgi:predicted TIM-barrel fold metal-dependent hydrolase
MVSVTDAHVHVVSSDLERFPLHLGGFGRDWWTDRPVDTAHVTADLDAAGVERAVIVQAVGPYGNDNRYAQAAVARSAGRFALVAAIDTDGADPARELASLAQGGDVAGVRVAAFTGDAPWLRDDRGTEIWRAAAAHGVNLVVACLAHHLADVANIARRFPEVTVALDHCGFPDLAGGPPYPRATPLFDLAEIATIHLKVTTIVLRDAGDDAGTLVAQLVDRFGADRVCWGSDHPQTFEVSYPEMTQLAFDATAALDADARAAVLDTTARRLWFGSR